MRFIIDGNGTISELAARDLLLDIAKPYPDAEFRINSRSVNYDEGLGNALSALFVLKDHGYRYDFFTDSEVDFEIEMVSDSDVPKTFIVLGDHTRPEEVKYCLENNIPVLDLERGLFPVTSVRQ